MSLLIFNKDITYKTDGTKTVPNFHCNITKRGVPITPLIYINHKISQKACRITNIHVWF